MKLFLLEAYGGWRPTDGKIEHFTVCAHTLDEAIAVVRQTPEGAPYRHIELIEESDEFTGDTPGIIEAGEGSYVEP